MQINDTGMLSEGDQTQLAYQCRHIATVFAVRI